MFAPEALNTLRHLARVLSNKWQRPYSAVFGHVKSQIMTLAVIRATHLCLRGSRVKCSAISEDRDLWDDGEGFFCLQNRHFESFPLPFDISNLNLL